MSAEVLLEGYKRLEKGEPPRPRFGFLEYTDADEEKPLHISGGGLITSESDAEKKRDNSDPEITKVLGSRRFAPHAFHFGKVNTNRMLSRLSKTDPTRFESVMSVSGDKVTSISNGPSSLTLNGVKLTYKDLALGKIMGEDLLALQKFK